MRVWLYDSESGREVEAELLEMTDEHVATANETWVTEFRRRRSLGIRDEDFLWDWPKYKDLAFQKRGGCGHVSVAAGQVQGMLIMRTVALSSRLASGAAVQPVSYLATAPWNRARPNVPGRFRRVGTLLICQAIRESIHRGFDGRIALHSLSGSDGFYRRLGFHDGGLDPAFRGLRYFELSPTQAINLLRASDSYVAEPRQFVP